jgi:hypothetical protein
MFWHTDTTWVIPVVSRISSSDALKMSEIYNDCRISESSGARAEVNIVDAEDNEPDEAELGDVGEDNVGEDVILSVLFDKGSAPRGSRTA